MFVSIFTMTPHQAAAYSPVASVTNAPSGLLTGEQGSPCASEAVRIVFDDERQSACLVKSAAIQLPRVSRIFAGGYAGSVESESGEVISFCPWKMAIVYISLATKVTITGKQCLEHRKRVVV
jgi:hypothetical protein